MKSANKFDEVAMLASETELDRELTMAAHTYCHAARHDEALGFTMTAAMEWQTAAELFAQDPAAANCCWQHWERIMGIPRRFALPIHEASAASTLAPTSELAAAA